MKNGHYYIQEISEIVGKHQTTIRNYIRRGLITEPKREWNGWRVFTNEHINQIKRLTANN